MRYIKSLGELGKGVTSQEWLGLLIDDIWEGFHLRDVVHGKFQVSLVRNKMSVLFSITVETIPGSEHSKFLITDRWFNIGDLKLRINEPSVISNELALRVYASIQFQKPAS